jgi:fatty-acid desaturase
MLFTGVFDLPWWGLVIVTLTLTHITIAAVTIFLHRHQAHRALDLHPLASHFFRFWLFLTTGMVTKEWAAIHRKHHAKCETVDDPHSPQIYGINRVLWGGVFLYVKEAHNKQTLERYGHGTPDDWLERNVYTRYASVGLIVMGLIDVAMFGIVPGLLILATQIVWIPFWAAGVINGIGHLGLPQLVQCRRQYQHLPRHSDRRRTAQQSPRLGSSAKLSNRVRVRYWLVYIRIPEMLGWRKSRRSRPAAIRQSQAGCDFETLQP